MHSLLSIVHFDTRILQQEIVHQQLLLVLRTHLWAKRLLDFCSAEDLREGEIPVEGKRDDLLQR